MKNFLLSTVLIILHLIENCNTFSFPMRGSNFRQLRLRVESRRNPRIAPSANTKMMFWGFLPNQPPDALPEPPIVEFSKEVSQLMKLIFPD